MIKFLRERDFHVLYLCAHTFFSNFQNHNKFVGVFFCFLFSFFKVKFCWQISPKISELTTDNRIILKILFVKLNISNILNKENQPTEHACLMPLSLEQVLWPLLVESRSGDISPPIAPLAAIHSEWGWSYLWTSKHWAVGKGDCRPLYPEENCSLTGLLNWAFVRKGSPWLSSPTL